MKTGAEQRLLKAFGRAVRAHREEFAVSQEKLAELAELHRTYIADIERGERNVGLINVVRTADALGVTASDLLDGLTLRRRRT